MIDEKSICLRCKHLEVITDDKGSEYTYALVDCAKHLYAFPLKSGVACPYFEERRKEMSEPCTIGCKECAQKYQFPYAYCCLAECGEHEFCRGCNKGIYLKGELSNDQN